ncbi:TonB-dependent receptor [Pseudoxanthomonas koreensis]|uniref:TonB-dependent receptor n=1 Tax=Pseudoxanthomonas koreensis TaxID=266061 RepID=UPI00139082BF|nr:TonB-dependent receptor [Pseudoxanthomonas koreensis]KAF1691265.1 TonB-dependent receptor [Pseudoxanthomonas koreensis]
MNNRNIRRKTPVTLLAASIGLALSTPFAFAQEAAAPQDPATEAASGQATDLDTVVVTGYRASLERAIDIKRGEAGVVDAIVSEDIGKFPDLNLAESLQRIPGVVITRDGGEGRNISVRGLGPDFTRVRINGMETMATVGSTDQNGGTSRSRGFDFNVFASDLFSQLIVRKTASADVEEGSLGATVDLVTAQPFDFDGFTAAASAQASYNDMAGAATPRFAGLISNTWADGKFGALLSVAYSEREVLEEGTGSGRWANGLSNGGFNAGSTFTDALAADVFHPRFPRYTWMKHEQERTGITGSLQFRPSDRTEFSLDALYSKIDATRNENYIEAISFSRSAAQGGKPETIVRDGYIDPSTGALMYGLFDGVDVRAENRYDEWNTEFMQVGLSGEHEFSDAFTLSGRIGRSTSEHENPIQTTIMMDKLNVDNYSYDYRGNKWAPVLDYGFDPTSPNGWTLSTIRMRANQVKNEFDTAQLDFNWSISPGFRLKGGIQSRDYTFTAREQRRAANEATVPNFADGTRIVPVDMTQLASLSGVNGSPGTWVVPNFNGIADYFDIFSGEGTWAFSPFAASNRDVNEKNHGAYLMGEFSTDLGNVPFSGNFGLRYVRTEQHTVGMNNSLVTFPYDREYSDTLPSMNLVAEVMPDLLIRFGAAKVMSRPGLFQLSAVPVVSVSGGARTVTGGNPNLDPIRADTYDLTAEWYFQDSALLSLGLFYKDIESFVQTSREVRPYSDSGLPISWLPSDISPNDDFVFSVPVNTPGGPLKGLEANYIQPFTFLPGNWSNLGVQLNYTFVDSQIQYVTSSGANSLNTDLTGLSRHAWNATLFYEGARFAGRISATNRDNYLIQVPGTEQGFTSDVHGQNGTTLIDASLRYKLSDQIEVSLEGINLTDEPSLESWVGANSQLPLDYSVTGRQYLLGIRYKF